MKANNKETWERYGTYEKSKQANQAQEKKEYKKHYVNSVIKKTDFMFSTKKMQFQYKNNRQANMSV